MSENNKESIIIGKPVLHNQTIFTSISIPNNVKKYIKSSKFMVNYDTSIVNDPSILNIPVISALLPLAWLTGIDIYVDTIDKQYVESMNQIQKEYKKIYPKGIFTTSITAKKIFKIIMIKIC